MGFWLLFFLLLLEHIQANDEVKNPVCVGDINIKENLKDFLQWKHCKVLEGSLIIHSYNKDFLSHNESQMQDVSLPELTEITDFLLLYKADHIRSLAKVLPKLAVIRGNKLTDNYALVIFRMIYMHTISLPSLTHIVKGGVKIEKNPNLCYADTVNWKKIIDKDWQEDISIKDNSEEERCPRTFPLNCPESGKCWNAKHCQKLIVPCPDGTDFPGGEEGLCYSEGGSHITRHCDMQCLGGCSGTTKADCISCKNMWLPNPNDHGDINSTLGCYEKCPARFVSYMNWTCITEDACMSKSTCSGSLMENKAVPYKILRSSTMGNMCVEECPGNYESKQVLRDGRIINECIKCENCPKICIGDLYVKSHESAKTYTGCTIIDGDLEIKISKSNIMAVLEENLSKIKVIRGSLRITRSNSLVSLHFLNSLEKIEGRHPFAQKDTKAPYAIEILENENLQKLFEENKNISISGKAFIHYNPRLCRKEITKLVSATGIDTGYEAEHLDISDTTNGDKVVCSELELKIRAQTMGDHKSKLILITFENFEKYLANKNDADVRSLLGYNIFYREITEEQFIHKNLTKYEGREACGGDTWEISNQRKSSSRISKESINSEVLEQCEKECPRNGNVQNCEDQCFKKAVEWIIYPEETSFIAHLKAYTPYAIYVSTIMTKSFSGSEDTGAQSKIIYVRTPVGIPEPVQKLEVTSSTTSSGLEVSWDPPRKPNGIIDHYDIIVKYYPLQEALINVDWCNEKKSNDKNKPTVNNPDLKTSVSPQLDCPVCKTGEVGGQKNVNWDLDEENFINNEYLENSIIHTIFRQKMPDGECNIKRHKRSSEQDDKLFSHIISRLSNDNEVESADKIIQVHLGDEKKTMLAKNETIKIGTDNFYFTKLYTELSGKQTPLKITIDHLKHYGRYSVKVRACHAVEGCNMFDRNQEICKTCSFEEEVVKKTIAKPNADDIVNPYSNSTKEPQFLIAMDTLKHGDMYIRWLSPQAPNEMITMYKLRMKKDLADESDEHINCISFNDPKISQWEERPGWTQYKLELSRSYYVSLKAVSLSGEGAWTSYQWVEVDRDSGHMIYIIPVVILLAILMLAAVGIGLVYKKRRSMTDSSAYLYSNMLSTAIKGGK